VSRRGSRLKRALMNSVHTPVEELCGKQRVAATCTRRVATRHDSDFSSLARARSSREKRPTLSRRDACACSCRSASERHSLHTSIPGCDDASPGPGAGEDVGPPGPRMSVCSRARAINAIQDDRLIKIMPRTHAPLFRPSGCFRMSFSRLAVVLRF